MVSLPDNSKPVVGPVLEWPPTEVDAFDRLLARVQAANGAALVWDPSVLKDRFLTYATERAGLLAHGTSRGELTSLEPSDQGDLEGRPVRAVFASSDGIWAMFFAILDWSRIVGTFNGTRRLTTHEGDRKGYVFTVFTNAETGSPFQPGWIYLLDRSSFGVSIDAEGGASDEWLSRVSVHPLARLPVAPEDFPFLSSIVVEPSD